MKRGEYLKKLQKMSIKDLVAERNKLKKKLFDLKMKNSVRWLKETHKIWEEKIKIARVNTVLKIKLMEKDGDNR